MFEEAPMVAGLLFILIAFPNEDGNDQYLQAMTAKSLMVLSWNLTSKIYAMVYDDTDPDKVEPM